MSCRFFPSFPERWPRLIAVLGALLAPVATVAAASPAILPFGANTWTELAQSKWRPLVVVFSTTDCVHCPKAIDDLAMAIRKADSRVRLVVVVMDGAGQEATLRADRHYRMANALYAFDGDAMALRFTVNPDWRGLTPYVALIPATGATRFHAGAPPSDVLRAFLQP